jgi:hypothetical protein
VQLEIFRRKGIKVLRLTERADEWALNYSGSTRWSKMLRPVIALASWRLQAGPPAPWQVRGQPG